MTISELGDIGSAVSGLAAVVLALAAIIGGSAGLGDWRRKQRAQRDLAAEEANSIRLRRQRLVHGWSSHGVDSFGVVLVTEPAEFAQAQQELAAGDPSDYVLMRVTSGGDGGHRLRERVRHDGFIARVPHEGEYEAMEAGLAALGITSRRTAMQRATAE